MRAWIRVLDRDELPDRRAVKAESPWGPLLLYRVDERVFAISNVCTHQGAPLHKGVIDTRTTTPMATCPAHGSMFDLHDGSVRRGPAMHPVASYEARIDERAVEVADPSGA